MPLGWVTADSTGLGAIGDNLLSAPLRHYYLASEAYSNISFRPSTVLKRPPPSDVLRAARYHTIPTYGHGRIDASLLKHPYYASEGDGQYGSWDYDSS